MLTQHTINWSVRTSSGYTYDCDPKSFLSNHDWKELVSMSHLENKTSLLVFYGSVL